MGNEVPKMGLILCISIHRHLLVYGWNSNGHSALVSSNIRLQGNAGDMLNLSVSMLGEERFHLVEKKMYFVVLELLTDHISVMWVESFPEKYTMFREDGLVG